MHCAFYTTRRLRVRDSDGNKDKRMYVSLTPDQNLEQEARMSREVGGFVA
jgi:hypothetical protein